MDIAADKFYSDFWSARAWSRVKGCPGLTSANRNRLLATGCNANEVIERCTPKLIFDYLYAIQHVTIYDMLSIAVDMVDIVVGVYDKLHPQEPRLRMLVPACRKLAESEIVNRALPEYRQTVRELAGVAEKVFYQSDVGTPFAKVPANISVTCLSITDIQYFPLHPRPLPGSDAYAFVAFIGHNAVHDASAIGVSKDKILDAMFKSNGRP